ncbi:hypothetical protein [Fusobacterium vincentii]|mgnify:CR=1 FL=1|uniref:hypothetical protein n=1 Tax=Fusobacterium vincentii TaxID=155615 RepID=UPI00324A6E3D
MKKFLLGLFLLLGVVSFALPNYVNTEKLKKSGYKLTEEGDYGFRIIREKNDGEGTLVLYYLDYTRDNPAKELSETSIKTAPEEFKYLASIESKKAYINKFVSKDDKGVYSFVGKKPKLKNCYLVIMHFTNKKLSDSEAEKVAETLLNEAESFLK